MIVEAPKYGARSRAAAISAPRLDAPTTNTMLRSTARGTGSWPSGGSAEGAREGLCTVTATGTSYPGERRSLAALRQRPVGQLLQGTPPLRPPRHRLRAPPDGRARPLEPPRCPRIAEPGAARAHAGPRRRPASGRVERDPLLLRRGHPVPARGPLRAGAGAPVAVLRAVLARAVHRRRAVLAPLRDRAHRGGPQGQARGRPEGPGRDGVASGRPRLSRRRAVLDRRHRPVRLHTRRRRGRVRSRALPGDPFLAVERRDAARARPHRRLSQPSHNCVKVRYHGFGCVTSSPPCVTES